MRRAAPPVLILSSALFLACGVLGGGEKYEDATLAEAMSGAVSSGTGTYRLSSPTVLAVKGDYALLRDGRTVQILAGDGFTGIFGALEGRDFRLLVKKWPNPYPHLRLQGYEVGGEVTESEWVLAESELPRIVDQKLYDRSLYEEVDPSGWDGSVPRDLVDRKVWIAATVRAIPFLPENGGGGEVEAGGPPAGENVPPAFETGGEESEADTGIVVHGRAVEEEKGPEKRYVITAGGASLELLPIAESGVMLLLEGHEAEGATFGLGGYVSELYPSRRQSESGIAGTFQLDLFDYGGKYVLQRP